MDDECREWQRCAHGYFRKRVVDDNVVDDLVQETCVRAWLTRHNGRVGEVALAWLFGIGWRVFADHCRRSRAQHRLVPPCALELDEMVAEPRASTIAVGGTLFPLSRVLAVLHQSIEQLPATCRELMRDRMRGLPLAVLARRHGIKVNVIKLRLFRGRHQLRRAILDRLQEEEENVVSRME